MTRRRSPGAGNFVSEWYGHRIYPEPRGGDAAVRAQRERTCPFLTHASGSPRNCVKSASSAGVCTVSSPSNGHRQDWLVCPYRALDPAVIDAAVDRLSGIASGERSVTAAVRLATDREDRDRVEAVLAGGGEAIVYYDHKLGGELSIRGTERSPEMSFDVTFARIRLRGGRPTLADFGILEVQTMDFHGSYRDAVRNLTDALRMHPDGFHAAIREHPEWLGESVEGPNIANVFKRTFYQMMFKFRLAEHRRCRGCVLAIPRSVWESWTPHLGQPEVVHTADGEVALASPGELRTEGRAWILVFDIDHDSKSSPSPITLEEAIRTDAGSIAWWALDRAPQAAIDSLDTDSGLYETLGRRLRTIWSEFDPGP